MINITSRSNPHITETGKLKDKKYRDISGLFAAHGKKLVYEAYLQKLQIKELYITPAFLQSNGNFVKEIEDAYPGIYVYLTDEAAFAKLTDEKSPEGVCAVTAKKAPSLSLTELPEDAFVLICDNMSDPGNLGTVLRSARAFDADAAVLSSGCADLYSPKVLRGAMGAAFSDGIMTGADTLSVIKTLKAEGYKTYAAALHIDAVRLSDADLSGRCAVVIGNEGHGLSADIINACGQALFIEMTGQSESLNASVAASVIMYQTYSKKRR